MDVLEGCVDECGVVAVELVDVEANLSGVEDEGCTFVVAGQAWVWLWECEGLDVLLVVEVIVVDVWDVGGEVTIGVGGEGGVCEEER